MCPPPPLPQVDFDHRSQGIVHKYARKIERDEDHPMGMRLTKDGLVIVIEAKDQVTVDEGDGGGYDDED